MELSNQKRRKQEIILSNVHPPNQRESLKNFHHASLSELEDLFVLLLANKNTQQLWCSIIFGLPSS